MRRVNVGPGAYCLQVWRVRFCIMCYRWTIGFTVAYQTPRRSSDG